MQVRAIATGALLLSCCVLNAPAAKADTTFNVSGQFSQSIYPISSGTFSGTLSIDTSINSRLDAVDITFQRDPYPFNFLNNSSASGDNWQFVAFNNGNEGLYLTFSTNPTPGSLAGLTGGTIVTGAVLNLVGGAFPVYAGLSGLISPASLPSRPPSTVPEPGSLGFIVLGLLVWAWIQSQLARKRNRHRLLPETRH